MRSSYPKTDVKLLLKDITGMMEPLDAGQRERRIQGGAHYSEMLPLEHEPTENYLKAYRRALELFCGPTARAVGALAERVYTDKGAGGVIVSLARAGIPVGILVKRYLKNKYGIDYRHYAVSIIRGRGIDKNAVDYILERHKAGDIQFLDGWTGKGAIAAELERAATRFYGLSHELAAAADPAGICRLYGTRKDLLIPSALLNAAVTGLISRTVLNDKVIGKGDFHGAVYYPELEDNDLSLEFIDAVESCFDYGGYIEPPSPPLREGTAAVENVARYYGIKDVNFIKPGIGETTRVLLRRVPELILVNPDYENSPETRHLYELAAERGARVVLSPVPLGGYAACGIIKKLRDV